MTWTQTLRRFLVFQAFLLWQGGFVFYTAVVVPIGTDILGSATDQGFITQRVTHWLNGFGVAWAMILAWDLVAERGPRRRWIVWAIITALLPALVSLHAAMDANLDVEDARVLNRLAFRNLHIAYLWVSTTQWVLSLLLAWRTLQTWSKRFGQDDRMENRICDRPPG